MGCYEWHNALHMMHTILHVMHNAWYMMHNVWHVMSNTWHMVNVLHMIHNVLHMIHNVWHVVHNVQQVKQLYNTSHTYDTWGIMHGTCHTMNYTRCMMHDMLELSHTPSCTEFEMPFSWIHIVHVHIWTCIPYPHALVDCQAHSHNYTLSPRVISSPTVDA